MTLKACGLCRFRGQPGEEMPCRECSSNYSNFEKPVLTDLEKAEEAVLEAVSSLKVAEAKFQAEKLRLENALALLALLRER